MIAPNLMVSDVKRSVNFYRDIIGMELMFYVYSDKTVYTNDTDLGSKIPVFATLKWQDFQLMLQATESLAEEMPEASKDLKPSFTGTIYFRGGAIKEISSRAGDNTVIKPPFVQWYGMEELYLRDPDGYVICIGEQKS